MRARRTSAAIVAGFAAVLTAVTLSAQMPDLSQMSGVPLPSGDLPAGTISVRVVRGSLTNNVAGQPVELHVGGEVLTASTDENGRAMFTTVPPGTTVHATTTVDGQRLASQEFAVPTNGGVRLILAARAAAAPATAAAPGKVTLGGGSRFVIEIADETVTLYAILDVANGQPDPVQPERPLVFEIPPEATNVTVLEGSSPLAKAEGKIVRVSGPLPSGSTSVQFAYQLPFSGGDLRIRQRLPLPLAATSLIVSRTPELTFNSRQISSQRETTMEGQSYYVANGPGIPAGAALEVDLKGLPHHSPLPRYLALTLAGAIVAAGLYFSLAGSTSRGDEQRRLEARREQLFGDLVKLEQQHAASPGSVKHYDVRRRDLIGQLEEVYARLDGLGSRLTVRPAESRDSVGVEPSLQTRRA
jgi:hypothetical protein